MVPIFARVGHRMKIAGTLILIGLLFAAPAKAAEVYQGQVVTAVAGELALEVSGQTMRFTVAPSATITIDDEPAVLTSLTRGHVAKIEAKRVKDGWQATSIEARSQR